MPLPVIPLVLAGGVAAAAAFGLGKKVPSTPKVDPEKAKEAITALKSGNHQLAAANALASQSEQTVRAVARGMLAAGKSEEARSLAKAFKELQKPVARKKSKKHKRATQTVAKPATKPALAAKPVSNSTATASRPAKKPARAPQDPKFVQAKSLASHLSGTVRYKENTALVSNYQKANNLTPDGKYGPGTARSLWNLYHIVPPNPYYWPKVNTQIELNKYSKFLDEIAANDPSVGNRVALLKGRLGK